MSCWVVSLCGALSTPAGRSKFAIRQTNYRVDVLVDGGGRDDEVLFFRVSEVCAHVREQGEVALGVVRVPFGHSIILLEYGSACGRPACRSALTSIFGQVEPGGFSTDWPGNSAVHADRRPHYDALRAAFIEQRSKLPTEFTGEPAVVGPLS